MGQYKWIAAIGWLCFAAGCDEPEITPTDVAPPMDDRGMEAGVVDPDMGDQDVDAEVDMSNCPPPTFAPDIDDFTANIAGPLYDACSLCHPANDPAAPTFNLSGMASDDARESASFVSTRCLTNPATCDIVAWHPEGHPGYVQEPLRSALVAWVENGAMIEECPGNPGSGRIDGGVVDDPDMAGIVPCEALPQPGDNVASSAQFRSEFEAPDGEGVSHNDILVGSCARNGACHAIAGEGDGYFLLEGDDECSIDWNFFVSQIYIDLLSPARSPLLTLPRDNNGHGGRSVFQGADDSRHVRLLRWIENENARRPR